MNDDELMHYGREGMRWGEHIFEDEYEYRGSPRHTGKYNSPQNQNNKYRIMEAPKNRRDDRRDNRRDRRDDRYGDRRNNNPPRSYNPPPMKDNRPDRPSRNDSYNDVLNSIKNTALTVGSITSVGVILSGILNKHGIFIFDPGGKRRAKWEKQKNRDNILDFIDDETTAAKWNASKLMRKLSKDLSSDDPHVRDRAEKEMKFVNGIFGSQKAKKNINNIKFNKKD
ncbi:hypothetical protein [Segatella bryantii]|uniref:hypothetical protein n=1 Tax=Segatella bryantii TaxID=77095 RepID=UPI002431DF98|nr:hypothetical protein [Segatella bryantii]